MEAEIEAIAVFPEALLIALQKIYPTKKRSQIEQKQRNVAQERRDE